MGISLVAGSARNWRMISSPRDVGQMKVEQDEIGMMPAGEIEPHASLHGGNQLYLLPASQDALDQAEIRKIVLYYRTVSRRAIPVTCPLRFAFPGGLAPTPFWNPRIRGSFTQKVAPWP